MSDAGAPGGGRPGLPDQAARDRIVHDLETCFLVEAGAGSGKTHSLVLRMVSLIASGRAETEGLAAITFTRKAAAELRERFQIRLEQAAATDPDPGRRERLRRAVATLDRAFLGTIHAFCARLLRERPVEAGLDPAFQEIDEDEDRRWSRAAWEAHLEQVRREEPHRLEELRELGVEPRDLFPLFQSLHTYPEVEPVVGEVPRPDLDPARRAFESYLGRARQQLPPVEPPRGWDDLQARIRRVSQSARFLRAGDDAGFVRLLEAFEAHPRPTLNRWPDRETALEALAAFERFRDEVAVPALTAWREHVHRPAVELARPAVERAALLREQAGRASFQDLLLRAARLLREAPQVREALARRYTHVLVDEFQDTDPIQAEVILLLTGEPLEETDWRRLAPRPGSLFVVGDPKQSIYRFRRADIDVYRRVKEQMVRAGGQVLHLSANFRSVEPLIGWVNGVFRERFPEEDDGFQPAYVPLAAVREAAARAPVRVVEIPAVPWHAREGIAREDADRLAAWIAHACRGGLELPRTPEERARGLDERARPGDFLMLHRDRTYLLDYARALEARGLPAEVTGARGYAATWEVVAFLDLLAFLAEPTDPVKLLAVLRGPLFGLSDADLHRLGTALGHGWSRFLDADRESLPGPGARAQEILRRWHGWTAELPAQAALERVLDATGLLPWTAASPGDSTRAGNLVKLVETARSAAAGLSFPLLVEVVRELIQTQELEAGSLFPGRPDAIRVMNLHRAKGLEAPVVVLAHPAGAADHEPTFHIRREGAEARGYFVATGPPAGGRGRPRLLALPPGWEEAAASERRYQAAEELRLLYVAATRARELLVVSRYPARPSSSPWYPLEEAGALERAPVLTPPQEPPPPPERVEVTAREVEAACRRTGEALARAREATSLRLAAGELAAGAGAPDEGVAAEPAPSPGPRPGEEAAAEAAAASLEGAFGPDGGAPGIAAVESDSWSPAEEGPDGEGGIPPGWLPDEDGALEPGGVAWGRAVHRLLELLALEAGRGGFRRRDGGGTGSPTAAPLEREELAALARHAAREAGLQDGEGAVPEEVLLRWLEPLFESELWQRIGRARRVEVEVPLGLGIGVRGLAGLDPALARLLAGANPDVPAVVRGQADLLFREEDGWVLVDYKTDRLPVAAGGGLEALAARYGLQQRIYAEAWERATGERVKERWLYLVRYGRAIRVG